MTKKLSAKITALTDELVWMEDISIEVTKGSWFNSTNF